MFTRVHKEGTVAGAGLAGVRAMAAGEGRQAAAGVQSRAGGDGPGSDDFEPRASEASPGSTAGGAVRVPVAMYETSQQAEERRGKEAAAASAVAAAAAGGVRQPAVATVGAGMWGDDEEEIPHIVHDYVMGWKITTPKHKAEMLEMLQVSDK